MAQSYERRFNGQKPEIVSFARLHGILPTLERYAKGGDLFSFSRFVNEAAGEKLPLLTKASVSTLEELADELVVAILRKLVNLEADNERLRMEQGIIRREKYEAVGQKKLNMAELLRVIA